MKVKLFNFSEEDFSIRKKGKIAQLVISSIERVKVVEVESSNVYKRGSRGFGSIGGL